VVSQSSSKRKKKSKSREEPYELLLARTKELAVPVEEIEDSADKHYYLNFKIEDTCYAISVEYVHAVISSFRLTEIPGIPGFIPGVTDHRGKILTIFDFHSFLGYSNTKITPESQLILISHNDVECGILVNSVYNVLSVPDSDIEKNLSTIKKETARYLKGMIRINKTLYAVITIRDVFESEKIKQLKDLSKG